MWQLTNTQIGRLRGEILALYAGINPEELFWQFLYDSLDVQLRELTAAAAFPVQVTEALVKLSATNRAAELLDKLEQTYRDAVPLLQVISQIRAEVAHSAGGAMAAQRVKALEDAYLLLDGLPFINRGRLRDILGELLDNARPARVGVVTGVALAGKSWSMHLVRAFCKNVQHHKVRRILLDLEKLQPGNDPKIVWTELMQALVHPQKPPDPPPVDTKGGQYIERLVEEVRKAWDVWEPPGTEEKPWLLIVFDHLEKNAGPAVGATILDFAEALAMAAAQRRLEGARVLLLGFPRAFDPVSAELTIEELAPRENIDPITLDEVKKYLAAVGAAIGRGAPQEVQDAADRALQEVAATLAPEARRAALVKFSANIGRHIGVLARAT